MTVFVMGFVCGIAVCLMACAIYGAMRLHQRCVQQRQEHAKQHDTLSRHEELLLCSLERFARRITVLEDKRTKVRSSKAR